MFGYWQNRKLKLTYFEVGFIGGFTQKTQSVFLGMYPGVWHVHCVHLSFCLLCSLCSFVAARVKERFLIFLL